MRPPIRLAHFMFLFGLALVLRPEDCPPVTGPIWPMLGYQILGLVIFLGAMGVMAHDKYKA